MSIHDGRADEEHLRGQDGKFIPEREYSEPQTTTPNPKQPLIQINTGSSASSSPEPARPDSTPPLVSLKVANPVTYLKAWWRRVMYNEGIDFRFRIHPVTAIAIALLISVGSFSVGRIVFPKDSIIYKYLPSLAPADPWRDTAFAGLVRYTKETGKYFLETKDSEAITLSLPANVDFSKQVGKRVFAAGKYNKDTNVLQVVSATDLEILPIRITPVPTVATSSATPAGSN